MTEEALKILFEDYDFVKQGNQIKITMPTKVNPRPLPSKTVLNNYNIVLSDSEQTKRPKLEFFKPVKFDTLDMLFYMEKSHVNTNSNVSLMVSLITERRQETKMPPYTILPAVVDLNSRVMIMETLAYLFAEDNDLEVLTFEEGIISDVTSAISMFENCKKLKAVNMSALHFNKITSTKRMFSNCTNLLKVAFPDQQSTALESAEEMFKNCVNLTEVDLTFMDIATDINTTNMFQGCLNLEKVVTKNPRILNELN